MTARKSQHITARALVASDKAICSFGDCFGRFAVGTTIPIEFPARLDWLRMAISKP
jgi:hypothetical protein